MMNIDVIKNAYEKGYCTHTMAAIITSSCMEAFNTSKDMYYDVLNISEDNIRYYIEKNYIGIHFKPFAWLDYIKEPSEETVEMVKKNADERKWNYIGRRKLDYRYETQKINYIKRSGLPPEIITSLRNEGVVVINVT